MANRLIWRTVYGELTVANRHMVNWHMAKRRIPFIVNGPKPQKKFSNNHCNFGAKSHSTNHKFDQIQSSQHHQHTYALCDTLFVLRMGAYIPFRSLHSFTQGNERIVIAMSAMK